MSKNFPYNPRKCTSASTLSGCGHKYLSKSIILFPTNSEVLELFEKTLIGGMSCVNARLDFDSFVLIGEKEQKLIYKIRNQQQEEMKVNELLQTFLRWMKTTSMVTL